MKTMNNNPMQEWNPETPFDISNSPAHNHRTFVSWEICVLEALRYIAQRDQPDHKETGIYYDGTEEWKIDDDGRAIKRNFVHAWKYKENGHISNMIRIYEITKKRWGKYNKKSDAKIMLYGSYTEPKQGNFIGVIQNTLLWVYDNSDQLYCAAISKGKGILKPIPQDILEYWKPEISTF